MPIFSNWADLPADTSAAPVERRRLQGSGATLVRIALPAGKVAERHSHEHEQFVQVLSGSGTLETEEGRQRFGAGSLFHFPAGTWHAAQFDTDTVLVETNLATAIA